MVVIVVVVVVDYIDMHGKAVRCCCRRYVTKMHSRRREDAPNEEEKRKNKQMMAKKEEDRPVGQREKKCQPPKVEGIEDGERVECRRRRWCCELAWSSSSAVRRLRCK